jgi:acyl carrier protein
MGLDFVELIISIEDAFDISIEDEQASKVVTVNDCYKLILNRVGNREVKS